MEPADEGLHLAESGRAVGAQHRDCAASSSSSSSDEARLPLLVKRHCRCRARAENFFNGRRNNSLHFESQSDGTRGPHGSEEPADTAQPTKPPPRAEIARTSVHHEVTHYGEAAHTIRHWLRGGQVVVKKSNDTPDPMGWRACLRALRPVAPLYDVTEGYIKVPHTDVQHYQVPATLSEFRTQLLNECSLPLLLETSDGYGEIEAEVQSLLGKTEYPLIVWHRYIKDKDSGWQRRADCLNRRVEPHEHQSCEAGALRALSGTQQALSNAQVLHLGDARGNPNGASSSSSSSSGAKSARSKASSAKSGSTGKATVDTDYQDPTTGRRLLERHWKGPHGTRPMLAQLQFIRAVVKCSGARLAVGERSGLLDLIALAGGIPVCQFIARGAHAPNDRLPEVYQSGCGMGHAVRFADAKTDSKSMHDACKVAISQREALMKELSAPEPFPVVVRCDPEVERKPGEFKKP